MTSFLLEKAAIQLKLAPSTFRKTFRFLPWGKRGSNGLARQTSGVCPGYHPFEPGKYLNHDGKLAQIKTVRHGVLWTELKRSEKDLLYGQFGTDCRQAFRLYTVVELERCS